MNTDVVQFKKEAACNSKDDDEIIEIINEVSSSSSVTNRPKPLMKAKIAKLNEKIEHLELIQKSLLETLKSRTNENKILKQKTAKLTANVNELNQELESKSNEISDLKSKLVNQQRQNYKSKTDIINKISSIKVFETLKPNDKINSKSLNFYKSLLRNNFIYFI
jgi:chromosome segregation ATPase